jgi:hypothetical protein
VVETEESGVTGHIVEQNQQALERVRSFVVQLHAISERENLLLNSDAPPEPPILKPHGAVSSL